MAPQEQFVYHQLASDFRGTVLYPLNHLAAVYPDIHAREAPKYAGREGVMSYRVPYLDAPWKHGHPLDLGPAAPGSRT